MTGVPLLFLGAGLSLVLAAGCGSREREEGGKAAAERARIALLDSTRLESLLRNRDGRALVLNEWATWCVPCREEFPDLIRVSGEFTGRPVDFVGLSVDYPDEVEKKVRPFVAGIGVPFPVFVQNFKRQKDLINRLSPDWSGAIPATFVYTRSGRLDTFLVGKQTYREFRSAVLAALRSGGRDPAHEPSDRR